MNKLLPKIEDLHPITENHKTFYDSGFNQKFELLNFEKQLQIINDIIRQTMIFSKYPNPENDAQTLIGDSYTAALISIKYLQELNIGFNHRLAFARKKPFELDNSNFKQTIVLIDDKDNNTYIFDATPIVDYKCGYVCKQNNQIYNEYILINEEIQTIYENIRKLKYNCYTKNINLKAVKNDLSDLKPFLKNDIFYNDIKEIYTLMNSHTKINNQPYIYSIEQRNKIIAYLKELRTELKDLISSDINYKRQIELVQIITKLSNFIELKQERICNIADNKYLMSELSPRWFLDKGLTLVMIKPSAYIFNWQEEVKEPFLEPNYKILGQYKGGLGYNSEMGLKLMRLFHPHGYKYERSMQGPTDVFLIERPADDVGKIKRALRQEYKQKVIEKKVMWFDNEPIDWNPICLNFVHSSDDPCEACMGYTAMYPEYQLMTRFMYPNPILIKEEKYGRVRI